MPENTDTESFENLPHEVIVEGEVVYQARDYAAGIAWLARNGLTGWVNLAEHNDGVRMPDSTDAVAPCRFCGETVTFDGIGAWVDSTDGDCCSGDDDGNNENEMHEPAGLCRDCGQPLEDDGTCDYAEMDKLEGLDHRTGKPLQHNAGDDSAYPDNDDDGAPRFVADESDPTTYPDNDDDGLERAVTDGPLT